jgi:hypothetical protein
MLGFEAAMPQFQALGAQVVGVSTDPGPSLAAWQKENNAGGKQILLSDFHRRQMLTAYGALETNAQSPVYRYAKRAYFIIDKAGMVKYVKVAPGARTRIGRQRPAFLVRPDRRDHGERIARSDPRDPPWLVDSRAAWISIRRVVEVGTMTVEERVAAFLVKNKGKAYCNACLARELGINHRQAGNATLALAESGRFHRDSGVCSKRPHNRSKKVSRA